MEKIFIFGKALWDVILRTDVKLEKDRFSLPFREKTIIKDFLQEPGGGVINVAMSLKNLGFDVLPQALIGKDHAGEGIREVLQERKIYTHLIGSTKYQTGTSIVILGENGLHTALIYSGANSYVRASDFDFRELKEARWWFILSWGNTDEKIIEKIIVNKEKLGKHLAFNPGKIQLESVEKIKPLLRVADILFVNEKELSLLLGKKIKTKELKEALVEAVGLGPKIVVVTLGIRGSVVYDGGHYFSTPILKAKVVDSLGCGDAYSSAFLAYFLKTGKIEKAILAGTINSSSVVSAKGAIAGLLDEKKIDKKFEKVRIKIKKENI